MAAMWLLFFLPQLTLLTQDVRPVLARYNFRIVTFPEATVAVSLVSDPIKRARSLYALYTSLRKEISSKLQLGYPSSATVVECATGAQFRSVIRACFGKAPPDYASAVAIPPSFIFMDRSTFLRLEGPELGEILGHEIAHLILHRSFRWIPRWLDEGLAMWASGEPIDRATLVSVRAWAARRGIIPIEELQTHFPRRHRRSAFAYVQSFCLVRYLIERRGGVAAVLKLLELSQKRRFREAWKLVYGEEPESTWEQWRVWEAARFNLATFLYYQLPAFTFPTLLFLVAVIRSRIRRRRFFSETEREGDLPGDIP